MKKELINVNGKSYLVELLTGDELLTTKDFCVDNTRYAIWRNLKMTNQNYYTARYYLGRGYKKIGRIYRKKNVG